MRARAVARFGVAAFRVYLKRLFSCFVNILWNFLSKVFVIKNCE
jgi:hypothetical protein